MILVYHKLIHSLFLSLFYFWGQIPIAPQEKDLIFFTSNVELFPPMSMEWDEPFHISTAIIDIKKDTNPGKKFIDEIKEIGCHSLQIRVFDTISLGEIEEMLSNISQERISSVELLLKYNDSFTIFEIAALCEKFHRLSIVTLYAAPEQNTYHVRPNRYGHVFYITDEIESEKCCGVILPNTFTINIKTFTESQQFNTCLNRKISIDTNGNIKNCPSMPQSYGNIENTTLQEAMNHPNFKQYWNISKDKIHACKDCEFRYICTDCRAYVEDPNDIYSKPLKCGYNPYSGEWSEWSSNPLKQKTMEHYGMRELVEKV